MTQRLWTLIVSGLALLAPSLTSAAGPAAPATTTPAVTAHAATTQTAAAQVQPPVAERKPYAVVSPNGTRDDPYYWLRDDTRSKPEVLGYLKAENAYYEAQSAPFRPLTETLSKEIIARVKQDDISVPYKYKDYVYYSRFETGKERAIQARHPLGSTKEQLLVDANREAEGRAFYQLGRRLVSPKQDLLAFLEDNAGRRQYTLRVREIATGADRPDRIEGLSNGGAWANDNQTLFYVENDPVTLLSTRVKRHLLGTDPKSDPIVYEEADHSFYLAVDKSGDERFILIRLRSTVETETLFIDAADPGAAPRPLAKRRRDHLYTADHIAGRWIIRTNLDAPNYRMMTVPDSAAAGSDAGAGSGATAGSGAGAGGTEGWKELLPYDGKVFIEAFALFRDFLVLNERSEGLLRLRVLPWSKLEQSTVIRSDEAAYAEELSINPEQGTDKLRYTHSSLITPDSIFELDMRTGSRTLLKRQPVLGGYDPANYVTERVWATARDGTKVPVSIAYRKGWKRDGTAPMYQTGYGAYGASSDPSFEIAAVSLLDRGFVYALAHIRGGQEMGRAWYDAGHLLNKKNSFTDFIDVTAYLVREKYAAPDKVFAMGGSAGGLLMGAVANMAGDQYRAIVAHVPFVDAVTTMLDDTIPLTSNEFDEWGNPKEKQYYDYILSYSPYDNVRAGSYPALYVTTGLNDSQVQYYEPAKWVARLRAAKTDSNPLLFKINMAAGHGGRSGRFESLKDTAEEYAFLLSLLGVRH
ncbi:MAG TPA: S9 family peptidase [Patescibacteria group bacterium]|nr:S9 family peptidase [Patescibacteria group bacterium]